MIVCDFRDGFSVKVSESKPEKCSAYGSCIRSQILEDETGADPEPPVGPSRSHISQIAKCTVTSSEVA